MAKNGVPQESILGPLLFLLYINDMQAVCDCNLFLYADDSALLISDKDVGRIQVNLGKELCKVRDWLSENKLMLHLGKIRCDSTGVIPEDSFCHTRGHFSLF